ncbi:Uncharacterised protein [Mycobacteroides abscessus subsp. abscessus]|nr:Uncharacterised protein [Mycobacteroides abscessus subsp. abscessus]
MALNIPEVQINDTIELSRAHRSSVRDEEVAGSNPVTPTCWLRHRESPDQSTWSGLSCLPGSTARSAGPGWQRGRSFVVPSTGLPGGVRRPSGSCAGRLSPRSLPDHHRDHVHGTPSSARRDPGMLDGGSFTIEFDEGTSAVLDWVTPRLPCPNTLCSLGAAEPVPCCGQLIAVMRRSGANSPTGDSGCVRHWRVQCRPEEGTR